MTRKTGKDRKRRERSKPRVQKQTVKDLDVRRAGHAGQVRGGHMQSGGTGGVS